MSEKIEIKTPVRYDIGDMDFYDADENIFSIEESIETARIINAHPELIWAVERFLSDHQIITTNKTGICSCNPCKIGRKALELATGGA